jgi:hypothetical protein
MNGVMAMNDEQQPVERPKYTEDILEFLRLLGQVVNTAMLYGAEHNLTVQATDRSYDYLVELLDKIDRLNLSMTEDELLADGRGVGSKNPFVNILTDKLRELEISGFTLLRHIPKEQYSKLVGILVMPPAFVGDGEGFAEALDRAQLDAVEVERVKYERVTEEETVVHKDEAGGEDGEGDEAGQLVEQIMAFLKGDVDHCEEKAGDLLEEMATDAEKLAELIMEATAIRQKNAEAVGSGESLADIVVGCLRRTFNGLMEQPSAKTKKGRRNIKKALLMLEKNILDKLHSLGMEDPGLDAAIEEAVENMEEELELESITTEYMKKRSAFEKTEKRIVKFIKTREEEDLEKLELEDRLYDAGLSSQGWRELLVKGGKDEDGAAPSGTGAGMGSGGGAAPMTGPEVPAELSTLAVLLAELDEMMAGATLDSQAAAEKMSGIAKQVEAVNEDAARKMDALATAMDQDEQAMAGVEEAERNKLKMSRRAMMELLAEIVQELCQSLSAINCAVGMCRAGHIGELNNEQFEVLTVAARCGARLDELLDRLIEIVGLPKGLSPDKESVYKTSGEA